jgi:hypothetical protein
MVAEGGAYRVVEDGFSGISNQEERMFHLRLRDRAPYRERRYDCE